MTVLIDPPRAEAHGRVWSHLVSDDSYEELHAFARRLGVPERGFDGDHYDLPAEWYDAAVAAGAVPVSSRELLRRLTEAGLRRPKARTPVPRHPGRPLFRPPRLRRGDLVAVVSPAGPLDTARLERGMARLESWGLRVRVERAAPSGADAASPPWPAHLAGADEERAAAFTRAWTHPETRAVWATRGGFGSHRVLAHLDWPRLAAAGPRLLVGFSDITALHQAVAARLGLASLHGPGVGGVGDGEDRALDRLRTVLLDGAALTLTGRPDEAAAGTGRVAEGVLVGGNLTTLASGAGAPDVRPAEGGLAFLEDVHEAPYRLDRALTQLSRSGWFAGVRGVALGRFTRCGDEKQVRAVLRDHLARLGVPVVWDLPVGHVPENHPLPLGVTARLDEEAGTLSVAPLLR